MGLAIEQARLAIAARQSPFGSIIVRENQIIAAGHNRVWQTCDPTAHAEVTTIRAGSATLNSIDFSGCILYSTCEPCPMCATAIHWSKFHAIVFGATIADAAAAGFSELTVPIADLYSQGKSPVRIIPGIRRSECAELFTLWLRTPGTRTY
jgi:tRNA(Arg) A34 adenosine deaminase TadA